MPGLVLRFVCAVDIFCMGSVSTVCRCLCLRLCFCCGVDGSVMRNEREVMDLVRQGLSARCQTATQVNEHSSRSHLLVILTLTTKVTTETDQQMDDMRQSNSSKAKSPGLNIWVFVHFCLTQCSPL